MMRPSEGYLQICKTVLIYGHLYRTRAVLDEKERGLKQQLRVIWLMLIIIGIIAIVGACGHQEEEIVPEGATSAGGLSTLCGSGTITYEKTYVFEDLACASSKILHFSPDDQPSKDGWVLVEVLEVMPAHDTSQLVFELSGCKEEPVFPAMTCSVLDTRYEWGYILPLRGVTSLPSMQLTGPAYNLGLGVRRSSPAPQFPESPNYPVCETIPLVDVRVQITICEY